MIENIEKLSAELQLKAFGDRYHFESREIQIRAARPTQDITASVAIRVLTWRGPS
jgi:hypothetical protein